MKTWNKWGLVRPYEQTLTTWISQWWQCNGRTKISTGAGCLFSFSPSVCAQQLAVRSRGPEECDVVSGDLTQGWESPSQSAHRPWSCPCLIRACREVKPTSLIMCCVISRSKAARNSAAWWVPSFTCLLPRAARVCYHTPPHHLTNLTIYKRWRNPSPPHFFNKPQGVKPLDQPTKRTSYLKHLFWTH